MSIRFEVTRTFQVSKQEAYRSLLDLQAAEKWMQGLVGIERLDEGEMKVGSEWKETRKMFGQEASEYFEVVELDEPNKIVYYVDGARGTTGKGEYIYTYLLTSVGDKTEVTLQGEIKGLTGLTKLFGKLMKGTFAKACAKDMDALKSYLEK